MKISEFRKLIREEVRKVIKEVKLDPNATYKVDVGASRGEFDPSDLKKVSGEPLMVAKAVKKKGNQDLRKPNRWWWRQVSGANQCGEFCYRRCTRALRVEFDSC